MAKRIKFASTTFLPESTDIVKVIAMQGVTDPELAIMFGLDPKIIKAWRKMYPSFNEALEEGRTIADAEVIAALHKKAIGYSYNTEVAVRGKGGVRIEMVKKTTEPDTNAIKFWLSNRDPDRWSERRHLQMTGKPGAPDIGVKSETKNELMSSILSLIIPKPDNIPERE